MNNSMIKIFSGYDIVQLEKDVNCFMVIQNKIYNVKHNITTESGYKDYHYIMVSYE